MKIEISNRAFYTITIVLIIAISSFFVIAQGTQNHPFAQLISTGESLHITTATDASSSNNGGFLILGDLAGQNLAFDDNEIMARNNHQPDTLFLQHDGGDTSINPNDGRVGIGTAHFSTYKVSIQGNQVAFTNNQDYQRGLHVGIRPDSSQWIDPPHHATGIVSTVLNHGELGANTVLDNLVGLSIQHGAYSDATSSSTITNSYGLKIAGYRQAGTIDNQYDIFLANPPTGGTLTNKHYGIYVQHSGENYFGGKVRVASDLQVDGSLTGQAFRHLYRIITYQSTCEMLSARMGNTHAQVTAATPATSTTSTTGNNLCQSMAANNGQTGWTCIGVPFVYNPTRYNDGHYSTDVRPTWNTCTRTFPYSSYQWFNPDTGTGYMMACCAK